MINETLIIEQVQQITNTSDFIYYLSKNIFLSSLVVYWLFQFLLTLIIGLSTTWKDRDKFWVIFILTQLIGAIILFFIFIFPVIPQWVSNIW